MSDAAELVAALGARGWSVGVAESLTGGAVVAEIVSIPGASATLRGGVVAYDTAVKHSLLGVDAALLAAHGPVHPDVALQMADGVRTAMTIDGQRADVGISTTGIAGPTSPDGQPVGTVHIAVVTPDRSVHRAFVFEGDRASVRAQARDAALSAAVQAVRE